MLLLLTGLLATGASTSLKDIAGGAVPARRVPAYFDDFLKEALCLAVKPAASGPARLVVSSSVDVRTRYSTDSVEDVQRELRNWITGLSEDEVAPEDLLQQERLLLAGLLRHSAHQCVYRLAPLFVACSRPLVFITEAALEAFGRESVLRALWLMEASGQQGGNSEYEAVCTALVAELHPRMPAHADRTPRERVSR